MGVFYTGVYYRGGGFISVEVYQKESIIGCDFHRG